MDQKDLLEIIATYTSVETHLLLMTAYDLKNTFVHIDYVVGYCHPLWQVSHSAPFIQDLIHYTEPIIVYSTYVAGELVLVKLERADNTLLSTIKYKDKFIHNDNGPACIVYRSSTVIYHYIQKGWYVDDKIRQYSIYSQCGGRLSLVTGEMVPPERCQFPELSRHKCPRCQYGGPHVRA